MINYVVYLEFSHLDLPKPVKDIFIDSIISVVKEKYNGTGVLVTADLKEAQILNNAADVNTISVHNNPVLDQSPDAFGVAFPGKNWGEVNVDDFPCDDMHDLASRVGTVSAHEAGHLILPGGHSVDGVNLMSEGEKTSGLLELTNGENLNFSEIQKSYMRGDFEISPDLTLAELEIDLIESITYDLPDDISEKQSHPETIVDDLDELDINVEVGDDIDIDDIFNI